MTRATAQRGPVRRRLALVVQRYGVEVNGGAEVLARWLAERLAADHEVTVHTTCAIDYHTWADHYPAGTTIENGVTVHRYPVDQTRDFKRFEKQTFDLFYRPHTPADEAAWVHAQGPYSSALLQALQEAEPWADAFIFFTYLYATTFFGLPPVRHKAILVPAAHDEPYLYLDAFRPLFREARALVYSTFAERDLVQRVMHNANVAHIIGGTGVNTPATTDADRFRRKHGLRDPFLLYAGRITPSKNVPELLSDFARYRRLDGRPLKLVLVGRAQMPLPSHPDVLALGFVAEEEKFDAIAAAEAIVIPSRYESLSIIALEAWQMGVPVLVNGECAVLKQQVQRSNGGLYYTSPAEFSAVLRRLRDNPGLRRQLGTQGRHFVRRHYSWDIILARYRALLETLF